jgi:integrase
MALAPNRGGGLGSTMAIMAPSGGPLKTAGLQGKSRRVRGSAPFGGSNGLVCLPMKDGRFWTDNAYRNWRSRIFAGAATAVGLDNARPYDLRHSLASLLFAEGRNPAEIAEMMGHSIETLLGTYVGVIEELRGEPQQLAETLIRAARGPQMDRLASQGEEV